MLEFRVKCKDNSRVSAKRLGLKAVSQSGT